MLKQRYNQELRSEVNNQPKYWPHPSLSTSDSPHLTQAVDSPRLSFISP